MNGSFPRHDGSIGQLPRDKNGTFSHNFFNTDAIWGAYWNLTQLWALSYPERYSDFVHTQLAIYKERGWFGDGIANSNFVSGVGTNFVGLTIAGAYQAGIRDYDTDLAYQAIKANELSGRNRPVGSGKLDVGAFVERGMYPTWKRIKPILLAPTFRPPTPWNTVSAPLQPPNWRKPWASSPITSN